MQLLQNSGSKNLGRNSTGAFGEQYVQRLLTGADRFNTGSQWRPQIKFDIQSQPWVSRAGAAAIPRATAEPAWGISAAGEPGVLAKGITWGLWIPHTFPAWLPVPAQSIATHSQLLIFLAAGTELGKQWAEKGESALVGIDAAFACYPLFCRNLSCPWLEKLGRLGSWFSCSNQS